MENLEGLLWEAFLMGHLQAQGKTVKDLTPADTGWGGENQLKEAFHKWFSERHGAVV